MAHTTPTTSSSQLTGHRSATDPWTSDMSTAGTPSSTSHRGGTGYGLMMSYQEISKMVSTLDLRAPDLPPDYTPPTEYRHKPRGPTIAELRRLAGYVDDAPAGVAVDPATTEASTPLRLPSPFETMAVAPEPLTDRDIRDPSAVQRTSARIPWIANVKQAQTYFRQDVGSAERLQPLLSQQELADPLADDDPFSTSTDAETNALVQPEHGLARLSGGLPPSAMFPRQPRRPPVESPRSIFPWDCTSHLNISQMLQQADTAWPGGGSGGANSSFHRPHPPIMHGHDQRPSINTHPQCSGMIVDGSIGGPVSKRSSRLVPLIVDGSIGGPSAAWNLQTSGMMHTQDVRPPVMYSGGLPPLDVIRQAGNIGAVPYHGLPVIARPRRQVFYPASGAATRLDYWRAQTETMSSTMEAASICASYGSVSDSGTNGPPFAFLSLPKELRLEIYALVFAAARPVTIASDQYIQGPASLLYTNTQIRYEAREAYFSHTRFVLDWRDLIRSTQWARNLEREDMERIQHLCLMRFELAPSFAYFRKAWREAMRQYALGVVNDIGRWWLRRDAIFVSLPLSDRHELRGFWQSVRLDDLEEWEMFGTERWPYFACKISTHPN